MLIRMIRVVTQPCLPRFWMQRIISDAETSSHKRALFTREHWMTCRPTSGNYPASV